MTKKKEVEPSDREVRRLRSEARFAYLDGRNKRAKELNKRADEMEKKLRQSAPKFWAYDHAMEPSGLVPRGLSA